MCLLCTKEYNEKTTQIYCCPSITEIPLLPNLIILGCSNTMIIESPKIHNCNMYYDNCIWLKEWYEENGNLKTFILLVDKINFLQKQYKKKKWNKFHKKIPLIRDIKNIIKSY